MSTNELEEGLKKALDMIKDLYTEEVNRIYENRLSGLGTLRELERRIITENKLLRDSSVGRAVA